VQAAHDIIRPPDCPATEYPTCAWPSPILRTKSPTPITILIAARYAAPATYPSRDKQTWFSTWNKDEGKKFEMTQIRIQTMACQ
jgi:hypothetical protein